MMPTSHMMMPMDMGDDESYGDEEYYDEEMDIDPMIVSADMEGGAVYQYGNQQVYVNA